MKQTIKREIKITPKALCEQTKAFDPECPNSGESLCRLFRFILPEWDKITRMAPWDVHISKNFNLYMHREFEKFNLKKGVDPIRTMITTPWFNNGWSSLDPTPENTIIIDAEVEMEEA